MTPEQLREAVRIRDAGRFRGELEASGGVNLQTVRAIAETASSGSASGALTHSAVSLDVALDWKVIGRRTGIQLASQAETAHNRCRTGLNCAAPARRCLLFGQTSTSFS